MVTFKVCAYHDRLWTSHIFVDIVGRIQVNNLGMCQIPFHAWIFVNFNEGQQIGLSSRRQNKM
jgi:hypothetical protein